jgi:hypothetical protein
MSVARVTNVESVRCRAQDEHHTTTAVYVTHTDMAYTDVTINTDHGGGYHHRHGISPLLDATTWSWIPANQLHIGDHLQSTNGAPVTIVAVRDYTTTMVTYNLTIDNLHTYYVEADATPVLVHNCSEDLYTINNHVIPRHTPGGAAADTTKSLFDLGVILKTGGRKRGAN